MPGPGDMRLFEPQILLAGAMYGGETNLLIGGGVVSTMLTMFTDNMWGRFYAYIAAAISFGSVAYSQYILRTTKVTGMTRR